MVNEQDNNGHEVRRPVEPQADPLSPGRDRERLADPAVAARMEGAAHADEMLAASADLDEMGMTEGRD